MSLFFEYGDWHETTHADDLKKLLRDIWSERREDMSEDGKVEGEDGRYQPFLQFDGDFVRANNYVGFIQNRDELIEIYPKVFRRLEGPDRNLMLQHIFYWFSYCRKWRFPFNQAQLDNRDIDSFPELIIYLMANQFLDTVSGQPFMQYHALEERSSTPRGSINFSRYITRSLVTGNQQQLECDHEPFLFDNKVNRIIKYCTHLLLNQTRFVENQRLLQEIVFVLDEVEDTPITFKDVSAVKLNPFFNNYSLIMEMCKTVLNQQIYSNNAYDFSQWCLLFPMEYIFEDFVAGFLEEHFSDHWKVEYQKSEAYLSTKPKAFQMQHDIFLTSKLDSERQIIIDTKYKLRYPTETDVKKDVAQDDLYQVVSYAYRRGCKEVILIYPNANEACNETSEFQIRSGFREDEILNIKIVEIPFWSEASFELLGAVIEKALQVILKPSVGPNGFLQEH